jgi:hypothetical protein
MSKYALRIDLLQGEAMSRTAEELNKGSLLVSWWLEQRSPYGRNAANTHTCPPYCTLFNTKFSASEDSTCSSTFATALEFCCTEGLSGQTGKPGAANWGLVLISKGKPPQCLLDAWELGSLSKLSSQLKSCLPGHRKGFGAPTCICVG